MSVYLLTVSEPNPVVFNWKPWFLREAILNDHETIQVTDVATWLIRFIRGGITHLKLYFKNTRELLYINYKSNVAIFRRKLDIHITPNVKFYHIKSITPEMEHQLITQILRPSFLLNCTFSGDTFVNSGLPFESKYLTAKLIYFFIPSYNHTYNTVDESGEYCASLVFQVIMKVLPKEHPLQQFQAKKLTATDVFLLFERYLDLDLQPSHLVFKYEAVKPVVEELILNTI